MTCRAVLVAVLLAACSGGDEREAPRAAPTAPTADWRLAERPAPEDRVLHLLVHERDCASGRDATGRIDVEVDERPDAISLRVTVERLDGDQTCQSNPDTPYDVHLDAPVAGRPISCTKADLDVLMAEVEGAGWGEGYAYVPDDRDDIAQQLADRCGDAISIERGTPIKTVGGS